MRVLVVGSTSLPNTNVACHVIGSSPEYKWDVVSSFQTSIDQWSGCPNVVKVTAYKDMKDGECDPTRGLVIEVKAASFFEKPWVKQRIANAKDLVIVTSSPLGTLEKPVLDSFDKVCISKTSAPDKQMQYYTLFADPTKQTAAEFKKVIKDLASDQFALLEKPDRVLQIKTFTTAWSVPTAEKKISVPKGGEHTDKPADGLNDGCVELWLCLTVSPGVQLDQAVTELQSMLGNDLIVSMFSKSMYRKHEDDHSVSVYMQVFQQRQDMFSALALNMLQALRASSIITKGSIVV